MDLFLYSEFCYNNTIHSSHKITSCYVNFRYHPIDNYPVKVVGSNVPASEKYILKLEKLRKDVRDT